MKKIFKSNKHTLIEVASLSDCEQIADIHADSFTAIWSAEEIASLLSQNQVISLIVREPNNLQQRKISGFVICRKAADEAEILTIAVKSNQRRKGFGQMLIDELIRQLYRDGIKKLFLEVDDQSTGAVKLYEKIGFKRVGSRSQYYSPSGKNSGNALIMRFDIN